jgi:hypothetical protein
VRVDCSRLSGVNGGDYFVADPDGGVVRELERFPDVEAQLLDAARSNEGLSPCAAIERARPLLARAAYNGLWSPSGTNWQPIRSVELTAEEVAGLTGEPAGACGLMVLARRRYDSILGDIADLCGFEQASHAEFIDLGIWLLAAQETARSHGWHLDVRALEAGQQREIADKLEKILAARPTADELLSSLQSDDHYPACLLTVMQGKPLELDEGYPGGLRPSSFDRLIEARSTQRVASPAVDLEPGCITELFGRAVEFLPEAHRSRVSFPVFSWHDELPSQVGKAMHAGIEGPEGLMQRASLSRLRDMLCKCSTLPRELVEWTSLPEQQLQEQGKEVSLPAHLVPRHIREKLCEGGHFTQESGRLLDHRRRPISPVRLMKLVRMMSRSFGKFFLSFQNSHPLLGFVLAPDAGAFHESVGKLVEHMTLLSRARGQVSIIKSGPLEIAGGAIRDLLADQIPGELEPVVTFQVGHPLGPDDPVSAGRPDEHTGLQERRLDKRAPRAPLSAHYILAADKRVLELAAERSVAVPIGTPEGG